MCVYVWEGMYMSACVCVRTYVCTPFFPQAFRKEVEEDWKEKRLDAVICPGMAVPAPPVGMHRFATGRPKSIPSGGVRLGSDS